MRIDNLRVYTPEGRFVPGSVGIEGERFAAPETAAGQVVDGQGLYAIPGLVDIHFHGCVAHDICDGTHEAIAAIARYQLQNGVTSICPATMTLPEAELQHICSTVAGYTPGPEQARLLGIYLEGPFLAHSKKGAQNPAFLQAPDIAIYRRLQEAAGGKIRVVAIAPEEPGGMELINALAGEVTLTLAHTAASYETASQALRQGARQVTHLYNAMPPFSHREPGVVGAAMDAPHCRVELITDGIHIHPAVVRATFRMFGPERIILISDSMMATGLRDGRYSLGGQAVDVCGRKATLTEGGAIAGSATNLLDCLRTAVHQMGIPLESAVRCATQNPAEAIGCAESIGSIAPGKLADLLLLDENLVLRQVYCGGRRIELGA